MPNAQFLPDHDLRDVSEVEEVIFVLDAADLGLKLKCTQTNKDGNTRGAVNHAPGVAGCNIYKYTVRLARP